MKLVISPQVIEDLKEIKTYISDDLYNPDAASRIIRKVRDSYKKLKDNPYMGVSLNTVVDIETDFRYLVNGSYLIFHRIIDDTVRIERVLYGRRNYIQILFKDIPLDDTFSEKTF